MKVRRRYRFKLKPTPEIEHVFTTMARHARFVWNKALRLNLERLYQGVPLIWYNLCGLLHLWKQSEEYGFLTSDRGQRAGVTAEAQGPVSGVLRRLRSDSARQASSPVQEAGGR